MNNQQLIAKGMLTWQSSKEQALPIANDWQRASPICLQLHMRSAGFTYKILPTMTSSLMGTALT